MKNRCYISLLVVALLAGTVSGQDSQMVVLPEINRVLAEGLEANYNIRIFRRNIDIAKVLVTANRGTFDPVLGLNGQHLFGTSPDLQFADRTGIEFYYSQYLRPGISFNTGANFLRYDGLQQQGQTFNINGVWFELGVPLLRGIGKNNQDNANLYIAQVEYSNSKVKFRSQVMDYIKRVSQSYATLVLRQHLINAYDTIITDLETVYADYRQMSEKGLLPEAELLVIKTAEVQARLKRQQTLIKLNSDYFSFLDLMGKPGSASYISEINSPMQNLEPGREEVAAYVLHRFSEMDSIIARSPDYNRFLLAKKVAGIQADAAKNNRLNKLDLKLRYNYYSSRTDIPWSESIILGQTNYPGSSFAVTLNYALPVMNRTLKSTYIARMKSLDIREQELKQFEVERRNEIRNSGFKLIDAVQRYYMQKEIVSLRKRVYENEILKFKHGQSSQIDVLTSNENYVNSLLQLNTVHQEVMTILIEFKYLCNELPSDPSELGEFDLLKF